jgi:DNA-binding NtrC family response regulator
MTRKIQLKDTGKENIRKRIDFLRDVTAALLDEVKNLSNLKIVNLENIFSLDEELKTFEIGIIKQALAKTGGNQKEAAQILKVKHSTLNSKIKRYEISLSEINKQ